MRSGRRFFIMGKRDVDPWQSFCASLRRAARGTLTPLSNGALSMLNGAGGEAGRPERVACLTVQDEGDVALARTLCAEYGVRFLLRQSGRADVDDGIGATDATSWLVIDPTLLQRLVKVDPHAPTSSALWRAQPGCRLGMLAQAGLTQFEGLDPEQTLACWAAARHDAYAPGSTHATGVLGADVMFADGTSETLGGFGAADTRALRSPRVQAMVPALFQLVHSEDGALLREQPIWLAHCRLDALVPLAPAPVNLAQLFLGSAGRHGWVMQWLLRAAPALPASEARIRAPMAPPAALVAAAARLDRATREVLDPHGLYGGTTKIV